MAWDKDKPAGNQKIRLSDEEIRANNAAIETQVGNDHDFGTSGTGEHVVVTLQKQTSDPANAANKGKLYAKAVGAHVELFYEDDDGSVTQLTTNGALYGTFPSGTKMLFYQDTAPTGWTIDDTIDDKVVFITKGSAAGGETGGGAHSTGSWTISGFVGHTHTFSTPSHKHEFPLNMDGRFSGTDSPPYGTGDNFTATVWIGEYNQTVTKATTKTNTPVNDAGGTTGSTGETHDGTWRPAAYCCIVAAKD